MMFQDSSIDRDINNINDNVDININDSAINIANHVSFDDRN